MKKLKKQKLTSKQKRELIYSLIFLTFCLWSIFEFKIQDFSPWSQIFRTITIPSIVLIGLILFLFFRRKIFSNNVSPSNTILLGQILTVIIMSAILTLPILGLTSFTNRIIGSQSDYNLEGEILSLDSSSYYNTSAHSTTTDYNVVISETKSNHKYEFGISHNEYSKLKGKTQFEKKIKKGFWGYLYEY